MFSLCESCQDWLFICLCSHVICLGDICLNISLEISQELVDGNLFGKTFCLIFWFAYETTVGKILITVVR